MNQRARRAALGAALIMVLASGRVWGQNLRLGPVLDRAVAPRTDRIVLAAAGDGFARLGPADEKRPADEELPPPWGWFIGPVAQVLNMPLDNLDPLTTDRKVDAFSDQTFLFGGMAGVIRKNLRLGIYYVTGNQKQTDLVNNKRRSASITYDGYGALLEWNRWQRTRRGNEYPDRIPYVRYGMLLGIIAGSGQIKLQATGLDLGTDREWWATAQPVLVYPYVGFWASPYDWLWLQLDLGYSFMVLDTSRNEFKNGDKKMVTADFPGGPHLGVKLFFGNNPNVDLPPY